MSLVRILLATSLLTIFRPLPATAQVFVSANDGKQILAAGTPTVPAHPAPDSVSLIELKDGAPRIVADIPAPTSVIGPPMSVAVAPDESFALVTAARKIDPADPTKLVPDDILSVIDLKTRRVTATLHAGAGASGVSINRAGTLVLVANRSEGTVSAFTIAGGVLTPAGKIALGDMNSGPSQVIFTRDDRHALVSRDGDHRISVLDIDGSRITVEPRVIVAGVRPYGMDSGGDGRFAVVANNGGAAVDVDTISLIRLDGETPRVVDTVSAGRTPEGVKVSPDGRFVAIVLHNGSGSPVGSPWHQYRGLLQVWAIQDGSLKLVASSPMGAWGQGAAWSKDGKTLLVQAMGDRRIETYGFDGKTLTPGPVLAMPAGPAGLRAAEP